MLFTNYRISWEGTLWRHRVITGAHRQLIVADSEVISCYPDNMVQLYTDPIAFPKSAVNIVFVYISSAVSLLAVWIKNVLRRWNEKIVSSGCQGSENALLLQPFNVNITNFTLVKQEGFAFIPETPSVSSWKLSCFSSVRSRIDEHASGASVTAPGGAALRGPDAALGVMKGHCPLSVSPLRLLGAGSRSWKAPYNRANEPTWTQGTNCCAPPSQGQTLNCSETIKVTR